jgi:hypothetical protein
MNGYRYVEADMPQKVIAKTIEEMMTDESMVNELISQLDQCIEPLG